MAAPVLSADLPSPVVPDGLGVNIHFTGAPARDLDLLQAAGFRFVRMDFVWSRVEKEKGVYAFEPYDQLTDALAQRGIRPLYILDYSNELYEKERSVRTEEGRQAFARFAAAAAARYRGRGVVWELWNEPNISFWQPQPGVNDYTALANVVFPAIRKADPQALCTAPATSGIPLDFLESCFRQGLLQWVDAVSVHPYRQQAPETVERDYLRLRALIARYRPDRPDLPVLSGEWGYSAVWSAYDEARQGQYLPRQFLTNLSLGIPLSIWYDWHDDGPDPKEAEHHFGTVTRDYQPKPAYLAMQRLVDALKGMRFVKRLDPASPEDRLLLFSDGPRHTLAAWTTGEAHDREIIPGQKTRLTGDPQYLPVPPEAKAILAEGAWRVVARSAGARGGAAAGEPGAPAFDVHVHNPFAEGIAVRLTATPAAPAKGRFAGATRFRLAPGEEKVVRWTGQFPRSTQEEIAIPVAATVANVESTQTVPFVLTNPVSLDVVPQPGGGLAAVIGNPSGDALTGTLSARVGAETLSFSVQIPVQGGNAQVRRQGPGQTQVVTVTTLAAGAVRISLPVRPEAAGEKVRLTLREGDAVIADTGNVRFVPVAATAEALRAHNDGDAKVPATFALVDARFTDPGAPVATGLRFTYDYGAGWKFVRIAPTQPLPLQGEPEAIGVWVKGDGSGCSLRLRFADQNGRTFQPEFGSLDFTEWRYLVAPLNNPRVGHWGGEGGESRIAYPIRVDTLALVDGRRTPVKGEVLLGGFRLRYRE